jgi:hypothetical protein
MAKIHARPEQIYEQARPIVADDRYSDGQV